MSSVRVFVANERDNEGESALMQVGVFDAMPRSAAAEVIQPSCASRRWVSEVVTGRPYGSMRRLIAGSDDVLADLSWTDVAEALAAHPRIGERAGGSDRESAWSRQEQAGAGDPSLEDRLVAGNIAYENRFGHVFLICATGRTAAQMLAALDQRLASPTDVERIVVRRELREIVRLRLIKTFR